MFAWIKKRKKPLIMSIKNERKIEIERIIEEFLKQCKDSDNIPLDIVAIARNEGFTVQRLNMDNDTTGMMLYSSNNNIAGLNTNKLIVVKNGLSEEQSRLVLAHELGHYKMFRTEPLTAHRRYSRLKNNKEEQEADYFARALLMPKKQIVAFINNLKGTEKELDNQYIIKAISEHFSVTEVKARLRFYDLQ